MLTFVIGAGTAIYLHWPALKSYTTYRSDTRQSPHWAAYHSDTFQDDDLLLRLATHNESPLQNLIFYLGTYRFDFITFSKYYSVVSYGAASMLFFVLGCRLFHRILAGFLCAAFFTLFPDQFEYFNGGFSKAWMIPLLFVCIYLMQRQKWRGILALMPFAALAYPMAAVLIGMTLLAYFILMWKDGMKAQARSIFQHLCLGSILAVTVLAIKYVNPPAGIGPLTARAELMTMPEMYAGGLNFYLPIPLLYKELLDQVSHPFTVFSGILIFFLLGRKNIIWERSWTALFLASAVGYIIAGYCFPHLYIPNRYSRYSIAVLVILWNTANWQVILERVSRPWARAVGLAGLMAIAGYLSTDSLDQGENTLNQKRYGDVSAFIRNLPAKILIAGHPFHMDDIAIQGRRSVLCNYKLAHPWYSDYYREIKQRTEAVFAAYYATDRETVNALYYRYGVTHFMIGKKYYHKSVYRDRKVYVNPYNDYIKKLTAARSPSEFILSHPPPAAVIYDEADYSLIQLPLR